MKTIYVLMEEFCNDGEYDFQVLGVSSSVEKLNEKMNDMIEEYKGYGCFEDEDFERAERDHNSYFISNDDYYGKLDIIEKEIL